MDGSKGALWWYVQEGIDAVKACASCDVGSAISISHNGYTHYWTASKRMDEGDSEGQTFSILKRYDDELHAEGISLRDNCVRTWLFVRDVDVNYAGAVKGRKDYFDLVGLTNHTH